jgi:hypothetical protein
MLNIQPKYIMVSRMENSPYSAISCNSNAVHMWNLQQTMDWRQQYSNTAIQRCSMFVIISISLPHIGTDNRRRTQPARLCLYCTIP